MTFDDLTDKERAQVEVERHVHDLRAVLDRLCTLRTDPVASQFFPAAERALSASLNRLQLLCSQPNPSLSIVRAS